MLKGIKETCIYTEDLESMRMFYHEKLGLEIINYSPGRHIFFRVGYSVLLVFNPEDSKLKDSPPAHFGNGPAHFAFEVDEVPFTFEMVFETDPVVDDVAVHVTQTERGLVLQCVNFDKPDGRGSAVPVALGEVCLLYTSPSPRDLSTPRMPSSA